MGVKLLLLNVIYQTIITASLDGVPLPFSGSIGKVTPIKPKPLPASAVSSSITPSSSICDSKDNFKLFLPAAKGSISREFSSPLAITSSSRALPVPKINSTSIENVKIPENLREKFLARNKSPVRSTKPDICSPEVSLPNKCPFSSSLSKFPNSVPTHSPLEIDKLSPLPSITSLPDLAVESSKTSSIDLLSSSSTTSQFLPLDGVTLPFFDSMGKVTPIKPKSLPTSTVSSSSPTCDSKDILKLFLPAAKGSISRDFSSPLVITSSSRALPVPKINSTSIENVKIPENLREKFLARNKSPIRSTKPDICSPEVSLPNKCPFSSSLSKFPNSVPTHSPLEVDKLSPLPSITSLPDLAVESSKTSSIDLLSSSSTTSQFLPLGGVTLPFSDSIGKVTPIKPKSLPTSTVSSSITSSSSPICDSKDNLKLFLPAAKGSISRDFSSPLVITSSSRALPVPKINSTSIENVKIPENLREIFLAQNKSPVRNTKPDIGLPIVPLPNKCQFSSPPSKLPNSLPTHFPLEIDELSPLSSRSSSSLPDIPVESLKRNGIDLLSSSFKSSQFSQLGGVTLPFSDSIGKVIPIKPKPLPTSTVPLSITSSPYLIYDSKDKSKLFPPAAKGPVSREFSSPLVFTSTSRALPVPKINSTSIENVKIPENLRQNFLARNKSPVRSTKPNICLPEVSLPNKCPFSSSPSKLPNSLPTHSPLEIDKLYPSPSITSLPDLAVESSKTSSIDLLSSSSKTSQFLPLGGITLPFSDSIGKVTPIKPKSFPTSTVSSSITSSSSPICYNKDNAILCPSAAKGPIISQEFSSPIAITSSSRALPVSKIDSRSIENVKITKKLRDFFLAQSPVRNAKPDIHSPKALVVKNYPFLLPPSNPLEINKLSPLPSIKSLPDVPLESLKSGDIDLLSFSSKTGQFSAPVSVALLPTSRIESSSTVEARKSLFSEHSTENTFSSLTSSLLSPYPLHYESRYLPTVQTPSEPLSYRPFYYKEAGNFDLPSHSCSHNILSPPNLSSVNNPNLVSHINEAYTLSYLDSIKTLQIPKPITPHPIQLPKIPSNMPISSHTVNLSQDTVTENLWPPKEVNAVPAPVAFESNLESKAALSSITLRNDQNLQNDRTSAFKLKSCSPTSPSNYFNSPLVPITISSPNVDVLSNKMSSFDFSKTTTPKILPVIGIYTETIEKMYPNDRGIYQNTLDSKNVPSLEIINLPCPSLYQHSSFTKECVPNPLKYSPPKIPNEPIPIIYSGTSLSPLAYSPTAILQTPITPVSYINQSTSSSIGESTSNMVSSITSLLSNITQNILSPFKPYIHSILQNNSQKPTYKIQSNPYTNTLLKPEPLSPVLSIPQCNPVNSISLLPVISTDCTNVQNLDPSTIVSLDPPFEVSPSPPLFISSPQLTAPVLSPTSLITFSTPPLCPSYLPSPILPLYPEIASPFHMEAPVYQVSTSKKDSDVEKIIDLMLLTEILNNDESFDWDDLDTLLTFLSLS